MRDVESMFIWSDGMDGWMVVVAVTLCFVLR